MKLRSEIDVNDKSSFESDSDALNSDNENLSCNSSDTTLYDAEHIFDTNID